MEKCKCDHGKFLGILLVPDTPFEKGMSISTWEDKRAENTRLIIENIQENVNNGTAIIIPNETKTTS